MRKAVKNAWLWEIVGYTCVNVSSVGMSAVATPRKTSMPPGTIMRPSTPLYARFNQGKIGVGVM